MANNFKRLYKGQVPTSLTTLFTGTASTQTIIKHMRVVNTSTLSAAQLSLWDSGSTDADKILSLVVFQPGEWAEWDGTITMVAGDSFRGQASVASVLTLAVYGDEVS